MSIAPAMGLCGRTIAMSVSATPDLATLGLLPGEDKLFLGAALTPLVYAGARVAYGGRIQHPGPVNFTLEMSTQLAETYRRQDTAPGSRPMIHYLRAEDAQGAGCDLLFQHALKLGALSEIRLLWGDVTVATLTPAGQIADVHVGTDAPIAVTSGEALAALPGLRNFFAGQVENGLEALRRVMTRDMDARIIMGGAIAHTAEGVSGIVAEALAALDAQKPILIIGGVGGASRDVGMQLGLIDDSQHVIREDRDYVDLNGIPSKARFDRQLQDVALRQAAFTRTLAQLGIVDECRRLAVTESHLEINALILAILSKWLPSMTRPPNESRATAQPSN